MGEMSEIYQLWFWMRMYAALWDEIGLQLI